ncbi:MAG: hypothetical protein KBF33_08550, partial [Comamonas sp.]|nr:hypothetical protein [Comamonas sp.]
RYFCRYFSFNKSKNPYFMRLSRDFSIPAEGTTLKVVSFHQLPAFFFFPSVERILKCVNARQSGPQSGGTWEHLGAHLGVHF